MEEKRRIVNGIEIIYRQKNRRYDARHLVIVMSGFGASGEFTYDAEHILQDCHAHVVWIKDCFGQHCAYYLCQGLDFSIEAAVLAFIDATLDELKLTRRHCTLLGFSKGGSAALYFGFKHDFRNIIATVPQMHIGAHVKPHWPKVATAMTGGVTPESISKLNALLPDALRADHSLDKNIFILTSPVDSQYAEHIAPYIGEFKKYTNFNLLMSKSRLVRAHNQVTAHNVPIVLALVYSLSMGAIPRYGYVEFVTDDADATGTPTAEPVAVLRRARISEGRIFPEGVAVLRGLDCPAYRDLGAKLIFESTERTFERPLAKGHRPQLARELYEDGFVNYDKGWFCTFQHQGMDISHIPAGCYKLSVRITCQNVTRTAELQCSLDLDVQEAAHDHRLRIYSSDKRVYFAKTRIAIAPT